MSADPLHTKASLSYLIRVGIWLGCKDGFILGLLCILFIALVYFLFTEHFDGPRGINVNDFISALSFVIVKDARFVLLLTTIAGSITGGLIGGVIYLARKSIRSIALEL